MPVDVTPFEGYPNYSSYRPLGNNYGNPVLNLLAYSAFGGNYAPRPEGDQDIYDVYQQRERTRGFMGLQAQQFSQNMLFKAAGLDPNNEVLNTLGHTLAGPDSPMARLLSPLIGGNPMAASQEAFAGFQGANIMGAFGRQTGVSSGEVAKLMSTLEKSFYKKEDLTTTGNKLNKEFTDRLITDPELARQAGIGVQDEASAEKTKKIGKSRRETAEALDSDVDTLVANELKKDTTDYKKELSKNISDHLKKTLLNSKKLTEEELKKATDPNGIINPEVVRNLTRAQKQRAAIEEAGLDYNKIKGTKLTDVAENITKNREAKDIRLNTINSLRAEYDSATSPADKKEIEKKIKQELISSGIKESDIKTTGGGILGFNSANKHIDIDYLNEVENKMKAKTYSEYMAQQYQQYKKAGGRYAGINFENTRGFNIEDFTSAYKTSAELGMLGSKGTFTGKFDQFMQNAGGTLSAARSVFGNKSGAELTSKISNLMGSDAVDMSSKSGSQDIEKYLRDMKATARVAGVSINAMLDTIDAAKQLANNNPRLKYLSSAATTDMTVKAFQTASALSSAMSSSEIRKAGGTQGIVAQQISERQRIGSSDQNLRLVALQQAYAGDPQKLAAVQAAMQKFKEGGISQQQLPEFISEIKKQKGMENVSTAELMRNMTDKYYMEQGKKNSKFFNTATDLSTQAVKKEFLLNAYYSGVSEVDRAGGEKAFEEAKKKNPSLNKSDFLADYTKKQLVSGYDEYLKQNPQGSLSDFVGSKLKGAPGATALMRDDLVGGTIMSSLYEATNPQVFENVKKIRENQVAVDTALDKKYASRYAPVITQAISKLAEGGKFDEGTAAQIMGIFGDTAKGEKLKPGLQQAVVSAGADDISHNYRDTIKGLNAATGAGLTEEALKNIQDAGFMDKDVGDAKGRLETLRKNKNKLGEAERKQLSALESLDKLGILSSQKAYSTAKKGAEGGHLAGGITAATITGQEAAIARADFEKQEGKTILGGVDTLLASAAKGNKDQEIQKDISAIKDYYRGDNKKLLTDMEKSEGLFNKASKEAKKYGVDLESEKFKGVVSGLKEVKNNFEEASEKAMGGKDMDDSGASSPQDEASKHLADLTKALNDSKLANAVVALAGKV